MLNYRINIIKAATITAAFFILTSSFVAQARSSVETLSTLKTKSTEMILQKQKPQALQSIKEFIKNESSKSAISDAQDFLLVTSQTFINKESQEAYETSLNLTTDNPKEAVKQVEVCLQIDPINADCIFQRLRLAFRNKNTSMIETQVQNMKNAVPGTKLDTWSQIITRKDDIEFKNKTIVKRFNEKPTEDAFVAASLELDRSFSAKNFSRAKEAIQYLEKNYSDWPDLVFYKIKIEVESAESKPEMTPEMKQLYSAKCRSLSKSIARKYRYDFLLCARG